MEWNVSAIVLAGQAMRTFVNAHQDSWSAARILATSPQVFSVKL